MFLKFGPHELDDNRADLLHSVPAELISTLSRLRWIDVVAPGSSFRFRDIEHDPGQLRIVLGVGYVMSGFVEFAAPQVTVTASGLPLSE